MSCTPSSSQQSRLYSSALNIVEMLNCTNVIVESLKVYNSPRYQSHQMNMTNLIVRNIYIWVNVTAQQELQEKRNSMQTLGPVTRELVPPSIVAGGGPVMNDVGVLALLRYNCYEYR